MDFNHNEGELPTNCTSLSDGFIDLPMVNKIKHITHRSLDIFTPDVQVEFVSIVPDSQYFTELEQILACIELNWNNQEYIITALKNSIAMGYKLTAPK
jgi:hypothetical protein